MIVVKNTTLHISCILVTRPKLRMPRRSVQLVGEVVEKMLDAAVDAAVDAVADIKVTIRSGSTIIYIGIEIFIQMVFRRG